MAAGVEDLTGGGSRSSTHSFQATLRAVGRILNPLKSKR